MITQIFNQECFKIISLFALAPGIKLNRNEIKEKTYMNNVLLDKALVKILSANILKKEKRLYSINFENDNSKKLTDICSKQYINLKELPLKIYFLITDFITQLSILKEIEVYLFGSYSKLIFNQKSDVDIAILGKINNKKVTNLVSKLEKKYAIKLEIHFFDKKEFYKNKQDPLIKDIIKNGERLI
ncbi:MAG: nucleotidyltransferase domain-containing protein [Nanoarchaeota archaeon]|nr:nucleotidyltransferase domain-containing protein [Nanoarchaeota archaeon]MBU1029679.1 nucleotidyltransferase domain-containing protein [Nanoarchaeota archaeon]MBU1849296.1 nucleotidyltransferase domain-containing protein [Nanoarchaeota archaeon]